jgi:hypothetical protein
LPHNIRIFLAVLIFVPTTVLGVGAIVIMLLRARRLPVCPHCLRPEVRAAHRAGVIEEGMTFFRVFPFRCHACRKRFHAFDLNGRMHNHESKERRAVRA